jgi:peptidase E
MVYVSESAGSVVTGIDIRANGRPGKNAEKYELTSTHGINFINAVFMPHWGLETKRTDYSEHKFPQTYNEDHAHIFLPNNSYIEIVGDSFKIVSVT